MTGEQALRRGSVEVVSLTGWGGGERTPCSWLWLPVVERGAHSFSFGHNDP